MQAVMGLLQAQSGAITISGGSAQRLGYVPQHEAVDWNFPVTVRDVVMMGQARQIGWFRWPGRQHWQAVDAALERVGMLHLRERQIGELSGGQRRRAFIARALVTQADTLLLDEPFSGVDAGAQNELMDVLHHLNDEGLTILLSTHDLNLAFQHFDKVMALNRRLIAYGTAKDVYRPDILSQLYGGRLATWDNGRQVMVFVDEHGCADC
jgi:ABC-type Mn2+/Zn2+ transport system ATPase subunit